MLAVLILMLLLLIVDWRQTQRIFAAGRRELNPVIRWAYARWAVYGIDVYFLSCAAVVLLIDAFLPQAPLVLSIATAVQAFVVARNWRRGIRP